jgi:hypothetical protein
MTSGESSFRIFWNFSIISSDGETPRLGMLGGCAFFRVSAPFPRPPSAPATAQSLRYTAVAFYSSRRRKRAIARLSISLGCKVRAPRSCPEKNCQALQVSFLKYCKGAWWYQASKCSFGTWYMSFPPLELEISLEREMYTFFAGRDLVKWSVGVRWLGSGPACQRPSPLWS